MRMARMFIDRTPANRAAFDAVVNAKELLIGFGVGDLPHFYITPNMDRFLKEASAAIGLGALESGDTKFVDGPTASKLCHEFQGGKLNNEFWPVASAPGSIEGPAANRVTEHLRLRACLKSLGRRSSTAGDCFRIRHRRFSVSERN
jgi:hypothetical protein